MAALQEEWGRHICPPIYFESHHLVGHLDLTIALLLPWEYHILDQAGEGNGWTEAMLRTRLVHMVRSRSYPPCITRFDISLTRTCLGIRGD